MVKYLADGTRLLYVLSSAKPKYTDIITQDWICSQDRSELCRRLTRAVINLPHLSRRPSRPNPDAKAESHRKDRYPRCVPDIRLLRTVTCPSHSVDHHGRNWRLRFLIMGGACLLLVCFSIAADSGFDTPQSYGIPYATFVTFTGSSVRFLSLVPPSTQLH